MALDELVFDVERVKLYVKPELHIYHENADDDPFIGIVPARICYTWGNQIFQERNLEDNEAINADLRYDIGKKIFITALSDFVAPLHILKLASETDPECVPLLEKYNKGMAEVSRVYSALLQTHTYTTLSKQPIITEKHFYKNSQGEWKVIGDYWLGVESHKELLQMADAVK